MKNFVFETTFIFNETSYFEELLTAEGMTATEKEKELKGLDLKDIDFKFIYRKDQNNSWTYTIYEGETKINWENIPNWMRSIVWDFEKENKLYFN